MATAARADRVLPHSRLWRVTDRASFRGLRRHGQRARRGPVAVTWCPATSAPVPRVAFAIGRAAGGAVARNRIRRRLRAALQELLVQDRLPAGTYLVSGTAEAADLPWPELVVLLDAAVAATPARAS